MQDQHETLIQKARQHYKNQEYAETISCCNQVLKKNPKNCAMLQLRGAAQQTLGNYSAAINDFNEILKLDPNNTLTKDLLAKALGLQRYIATPFTDQEKHEQLVLKRALETRQKAEAEQQKRFLEQQRVADAQRLQQQAAARAAEQLKMIKEQAKLHYNNKKYAETVSCCNQILQAEPNNISIRELRGAAKFRLEQYREAIQDLESPSARALRFRGAAKCKLGDYDQAILDLEKAIELEPRNDFAKNYLEEARELQKQSTHLASLKAKVEEFSRNSVSGGTSETLAMYEEIIAADPKNRRAWIGKADSLRVKRKYDEAIRLYESYCDPNDALDCARMGIAFFCSSQFSLASKYFETALCANPREFFAVQGKALCLIQERKNQEASRLLENVDQFLQKKISKNHEVELLCCRGDMYLAVMYYTDAHKSFKQVKILVPENQFIKSRLPSSTSEYTDILDTLKDTNKTLKEINTMLTSLIAEYKNLSSLVIIKEKGYQRAFEHYEKELLKDPKDQPALLGRATALFFLGKVGSALRAFEEMLEMDLHSHTKSIVLDRKAVCILAQGKKREAEELFRATEDGFSSDIAALKELWSNRSEMLSAVGQRDAAQQYFSKAKRVDRTGFDEAMDKKDYLQAARLCDDILDFLPGNIEFWKARLQIATAMQSVDVELKCLDKLIVLDSKNKTDYTTKKLELFRKNKLNDEARVYCESVLRDDPNHRVALLCKKEMLFERAEVLSVTGDYPQAVQIYDQLITAYVNDKKAFVLKGRNLLKMSCFDEALGCFAESRAEENAAGIYYSGLVSFVREGNITRAAQYFRQALILFPENILACQGLAFCYLLEEDNSESDRLFTEIEYLLSLGKKTDLELYEIYSNRGDMYFYARAFDKARIAYECAQKYQPHDAYIKGRLEEMDSLPAFLRTRDSTVISREQLVFGDEKGRGTFGIVYKGEWMYKDPFKTTIAIKQLKSDVDVGGFKKEIEIHSTLNFYSVVRVYGVVLEKAGQPMCMIMEYMELGSLRDVLDVYKDKPESERLEWSIRLSIAVDIAKGIAYLHAQNPPLIHRDIKSLNILLDGRFRAKVSDFGLAKLITDVTQSNYAKGTPRWMAPELFELTAEYTTASDVFSLAVVFWELASFVLPYKETMGDKLRIKSGVEKGERETFGERTPNTPKEYRELVESGWDHEPKKRPSAEKVVAKLDAIFAKYPLVPTMFSSSKGSGDYIDNTPASTQSNGSYMGNNK